MYRKPRSPHICLLHIRDNEYKSTYSEGWKYKHRENPILEIILMLIIPLWKQFVDKTLQHIKLYNFIFRNKHIENTLANSKLKHPLGVVLEET